MIFRSQNYIKRIYELIIIGLPACGLAIDGRMQMSNSMKKQITTLFRVIILKYVATRIVLFSQEKRKKKTSTMDKWPRFMFNHFIIVMGNSSVAFILFTKIICSFTYSLRLSTRRCIEVLCVLDDSMNEYTQYGYLGYQPKIHDEQKLTLPLRGYNSEYV